ncbi:MAG: XrtA/PEP-CTERM system TPR-repeat protein PrsT [Azonexus sp.]
MSRQTRTSLPFDQSSTRRRVDLAIRLSAALVTSMGLVTNGSATPEKASIYYEDALKRYEKNEMPGAVIQLKNALQQDSKMLAAHLLLGKALLRNDDLKGAEAAFEEALKQGVNRGEVALPLGQVYLALGRPEAVIEKISALGLSPALQVEVLTMRANAYFEQGKAVPATQSLENARAIDPKSASPLIAEVPMLLAAGRLDLAKEKAAKALELAPNNAYAWNMKASVLHAAFDVGGALAAYDKALSLLPNHVDARIARAALLIDLKRDAEARKDLDFLQKAAEDEPRAAYLRAVLAGHQGDGPLLSAALTEVTRTIDALPPAWLARREQLLMAAALAHHGLGNYQKAREYLDVIVARSPRNIGAKKLLASVYIEAKDYGRALSLLESLNRATPDDPQVMFMLGTLHLTQKHYAQASELLERAAARTNSAEMKRSLAFSQLGLGQNEKGIGNLEKAFAANPGDTQAGMSLAMIYMRQTKTDKAIKTAEAMVKRDPDNLTALNFLGSLKGATGDKAGARTAYTQVLARDAEFTPAAMNLARLDMGEKRFDEARRRLDALLKKRNDNYQVLYEYGLLEQRAGKPVEAIRHLTKAGDVQRTDPTPLLALVDLHLNQGQGDLALKVAKALAMNFATNLQVQLTLARTYLANGDAASARTVLAGATRLAEFNAKSQVAIARMQLAAGNPDGAAYSISKAQQDSPGDLAAMVLAVQVETRRGDAVKADIALKTLTAKYPVSLETARASADLAMSRGQFPIAIAGYRKVLAGAENTGNALALVQAHMAAGEAGKAAAFLETWVKSRPNDIAAQKALAETQFRSGQLVAAQQSYQRVISGDPEDASALNNYANLLLQVNDPGAQEAAEKALKLAPTHPAYADTLGWILVSKGQVEAGLRYLREARLRNPGNGEIRFHLAYALNKIGRKDEAREELSAALTGPGRVSNSVTVGQLKKDLGL